MSYLTVDGLRSAGFYAGQVWTQLRLKSAVAFAIAWIRASTLKAWQKKAWLSAYNVTPIRFGGQKKGVEGEYDPATGIVTVFFISYRSVDRLAAVLIHEIGHAAGLGEIEAEILESMVAAQHATPLTKCEFALHESELELHESGLLVGKWFVIDKERNVVYHVDGGIARFLNPAPCTE